MDSDSRPDEPSWLEELLADSIPSPRAVQARLVRQANVAPGPAAAAAASFSATNPWSTGSREWNTSSANRRDLRSGNSFPSGSPSVSNRSGSPSDVSTSMNSDMQNYMTSNDRASDRSTASFQHSTRNPNSEAFYNATINTSGQTSFQQRRADQALASYFTNTGSSQQGARVSNVHSTAIQPGQSHGVQNAIQPTSACTFASRSFVPNPTSRPFVPTTMALLGPGFQRAPTETERRLQVISGMSLNYMGDPSNMHNHSAVALPEHENTCFWITDLPPDVRVSEITAAIRNCGRIFALHINRQEAHIRGAACKLVFFGMREAQRFVRDYMDRQALYVRGWRARIRYNRIKVPEQAGLPDHYSRCLRVTGPYHLIDFRFLDNYLSARLTYEIDVVYWSARQKAVIIHFSSHRGQAALAYKALTMDSIFVDNGVRVEYAWDPCAPLPVPQHPSLPAPGEGSA